MQPRTISLFFALALALAACGGTVDISPTELPNAVQNVPYNAKLSGTGKQPITWKLVSGTLPPGVTLNQGNGLVSGTPSAPGTFTFTVTAADNSTFADATGRKDFSLTVIPELKLAPVLPPARKDAPYSVKVEPSGGVAPYTVTVTGLKCGLGFDPATNTISGSACLENNYTVTVTASDSGNPQQSKTAQATLLVKPPQVSIGTTSLPQGQVGQPYSFALVAVDGSHTFNWEVTNGILPNGLSLDQSSGTISGTPTEAANSQVEFTVHDLNSQPDEAHKSFNLVVVQ